MDTTPPQAPPALASTSNEAAVAVVQRMAATHAWILAEEARLPVAPEHPTAGAGGLDRYLGEVDAWWETAIAAEPGRPAVTRHDALAARLSTLLTDSAELRRVDGTLDDDAADLAQAVVRANGSATAPTLHARELVLGSVAYAGALVVTDDARPDLALLFSPARGWQSFASIDALHRTTESLLRERIASGELIPGVAPPDLDNLANEGFVTSRPIAGSITDTLVQRIRHVQEDHATMAWSVAETASPLDLSAAMARSVALHPHADVEAMLAHRGALLQEKIVAEQLSRVTDDVREGWQHARAVYDGVLEQTAAQARLQGWTRPATDRVFAQNYLMAALKSSGITDHPDDIRVDIFPAPRMPSTFGAANGPRSVRDAWAVTPAPSTLMTSSSLVDLALRNTYRSDDRNMRVRGAGGRDLSGILLPEYMPALLRAWNVGAKYRDEVAQLLGKSPTTAAQRGAAADVQLRRMLLEAEDARVGDAQPGAVRSFNEDRLERGYHWVRAVLEAELPGGNPAMIDGHRIVMKQVLYKGAALKDVFIVGAAQPASVPNVVVYTPDAPDGRAFREFDDQHKADEQFFYATRFQDYLLDRLPADAAEITPHGERRFRVSHAARQRRFVLNQTRPFGTQTDADFVVQVVNGSFLGAWNNARIAHLDNLLAQTARSASEADDDVAFRFDPEAIGRAVSSFLGRPFQPAWRAYDSIKAGDHASAFVDLTASYVAALDIAGARVVVTRQAKPILVRAARARVGLPGIPAARTRLVSSKVRLAQADAIMEPRYMARGIGAREATSVRNGVYTIGGKQYIESGSALYGVRWDAGARRWRLSRADTQATTSTTPLVRSPSGRWTVDRDYGLPGGAPPTSTPPPMPGVEELGRTATNVFRQLRERFGTAHAHRINLTLGENAFRGRSLLQPLTPSEVVEATRRFGAHQARQVATVRPVARTPARPVAQAMPRANAAQPAIPAAGGATHLQEIQHIVPLMRYEWPREIFIQIPRITRARVTRELVIRQNTIQNHRGMLSTAMEPPRTAAGTSPIGDWVRIDLQRLAARPAGRDIGYRLLRGEAPAGLPVYIFGTEETTSLVLLQGEFSVLPRF